MPLETWLAFILFWMGFEFLPGPNTAFAVGTALVNSLPRALMTSIGMALAAIVHTLIASLGLSALMFASADWFTVVKWVGVAYLVWLGLRRWRGASAVEVKPERNRGSALGLTFKGMLVSLSNPKSIYWSMAVVPQFLSPELPFAPQVLTLTMSAAAVSLLVYSIYSTFAVRLGKWMDAIGRGRMQNRVTGSFYFVAAGTLAIAGQSPSA